MANKLPENPLSPELSQHLKRLVDVYESNVANSKESAAANESLVREARRFVDLFQSYCQDSIESSAKSARSSSRKLFHGFLGLGLSVVIAAAGYFLNGHLENLRHAREDTQATIDRKLAKLNSISDALTDVRTVKDSAQIDCETPKYDLREVDHQRLDARNRLVKAIRNADFYFSEDAYNETRTFLEWEASFKDFCKDDVPNDAEWIRRHKAIEDLIRKSFPKSTFARD